MIALPPNRDQVGRVVRNTLPSFYKTGPSAFVPRQFLRVFSLHTSRQLEAEEDKSAMANWAGMRRSGYVSFLIWKD